MIHMMTVSDIFAENCYFFIDPSTNSGFIIDPGAEAGKIYDFIRKNNLNIEKILLTHGHFDHTGAVRQLHENLNIPYCISIPGQQYLVDPHLNLSANFGRDSILPEAEFFNYGDFIALSANPSFGLQVIATPGHTPDSVTYFNPDDKAAFVGDAIFLGQPGTSEFPGGNQKELMKSITDKILRLPDDTRLYSGHTPPTSVAREKPNYFYNY